MKRYAIIASIGIHEWDEKGRHVIDCTVRDAEFVTDSNSKSELMDMVAKKTNHFTIYLNNGKWYSLRVLTRADAKYELARFGKSW